MKGDRFDYLAKALLLFGIYFITARVGLSFDAVSGFATFVWPPTGISLAALLILGYRFWPSILAAAFLVNFVTGAPAFVALGIGIGNSLEALVGAFLLNRLIKFHLSLDRVSDVIGLVVLAGFCSTLLSATIGTSSLLVGDLISSDMYAETWTAWWIGDALSNLVIAPLVLVWSVRLRRGVSLKKLRRGIAPIFTLTAISVIVFHGIRRFEVGPFEFAYLVFPVLILIALRYGQVGSVSATLVVALIALWGTVSGLGPFSGNEASQNLLLLQSFVGTAAITFMFMAAVVSEQKRTLKYQQQLVQKTKLLSEQRARLIALNRTKDEFVAIASHQLRTPATAVKQYIGLLLEGYGDPLTKGQKEFLEQAYDNNERQLHVVDDILRIAQLDLGKIKLHVKKYDIGKLVEEAAASLERKFEERRQKIELRKPTRPVLANIDRDQFRLVVENLLENAANYSYEGTTISCVVRKDKNGQAQVAITDQGVGIAPSDFEKLFQKFSRINNPLSNAVNGTGLGLYYAKKITRLHKGDIEVSSSRDGGTIFTIKLPPRV